MSQYSARSGGSRNYAKNYRKVAHYSNVDESLFGERKTSSQPRPGSGSGEDPRGAALRATGRQLSGPGRVVSNAPVAVIGSYDLKRIKASTIIKTPEDIQREKEDFAKAQAERQRASKARKQRMLQLEAERKRAQPKSVLEQEEEAAKAAIRKKAVHLRDEARDDVKTMNAFQKYAKTVTIRDQQKREKIERERRAKEEDRVKDVEMELDRLRVVKMYKDREEARKKTFVDARQMIEVQIEGRSKQRDAEKEAVRREQEQLKRQLEEQVAQEKIELAEQQKRQQAHLEEVLKANAAAIAVKEKLKQDEIEEDKRIMEYLKVEDEKKRRREEEEEALKQQRELEIARLRAQQEKSQDKAAELDALRAKRAFESAERDYRKKQLELARKKRAQQEEMIASRKQQQADKEWALALEAKREREEFLRNQAVQKEWLQKERAESESKRYASLNHKDEIRSMIEIREEAKRAERQAYLAQAEVEKREREAELERLRRIRDRKVRELTDAGVDERYTVQLAGFRPEDILSKDYKLGGRIPTIN